MELRNTGETRFIKSDLIEHGIVFLNPKGLRNLNKVNKIASAVADKVGIKEGNLITEQFLTSKGEVYSIRNSSRIDDHEVSSLTLKITTG